MVIEHLLCQGRARLDARLRGEAQEGLDRFLRAGLASWAGDDLVIAPEGLPYARTITALFDPYRKGTARHFSSAV